MELIIKWLASIFETFKQKNPLVAAIILAVSATVLTGFDNAEFYGLITLPDWGVVITKWVSGFVLAATGSQTFRYLPSDKQKKAR